jgi:hypothetical protein
MRLGGFEQFHAARPLSCSLRARVQTKSAESAKCLSHNEKKSCEALQPGAMALQVTCGAQRIESAVFDAPQHSAPMAAKRCAPALADALSLPIELGISGGTMARITVKDLQRSDTLDRQAMLAIAGGSRSGVRPLDTQRAQQRSRVVDYPPGFGTAPRGTAGANGS